MMFSVVTATQHPLLGMWSELAVGSPEVFLHYLSLTPRSFKPVLFYRACDLLIFGILSCQSALVTLIDSGCVVILALLNSF